MVQSAKGHTLYQTFMSSDAQKVLSMCHTHHKKKNKKKKQEALRKQTGIYSKWKCIEVIQEKISEVLCAPSLDFERDNETRIRVRTKLIPGTCMC